MRTIWKYQIPIQDYFELELPKDAEILTVQMQYGIPCLWALVDPTAQQEFRLFRLSGTGHPVETLNLDYIGTVQQAEGQLIWHVFEILREKS
ncbi:MAG: hypothetical protein KKB38_20300 [Gammaproteobacteria bacterium]|nr:hypothetical protein [Gammaproteobacteria bacterium]